MNRLYLLMAFMALPAMILAQTGTAQAQGPNYASQPYTPAVPGPSMTTSYGGYGGYGAYGGGGGGTAAGSALSGAGNAMNGLGNAMSGAGNMHLSNSAAAINMTQAQKNEQQNKLSGEQTYFAMRNENEAYQKAQIGPPPTKEQMARWAREDAPKAITSSEVDPASGQINWPDALTQDNYAKQRTYLDQLMAKKTKYGRLSFADQQQARKVIETMFDVLKTQVQKMPSDDYMAARSFLRSLIYATSKTDVS